MPAETYEGQPCRHCGGTRRYRNAHCVVCVTAKRSEARDKKREETIYRYSEQLRNRRRKALRRMEARNG